MTDNIESRTGIYPMQFDVPNENDTGSTVHYVILDHDAKLAYNYTDKATATKALLLGNFAPQVLAAVSKGFPELYDEMLRLLDEGELIDADEDEG